MEKQEILKDYEIKKDHAEAQAVIEDLTQAVNGHSVHGYSQLIGKNPYDSLIDRYTNTTQGWKTAIS